MHKIVFCLLLPFLALESAAPLQISESFTHSPAGRALEILEDRSFQQTAQGVLAQPGLNWKPVDQNYHSFGFTNSRWWVRGRIVNSLQSAQTVYLTLDWPIIDHLEFYSANPAGRILQQITVGDNLPFSARPLPNDPKFTFPVELGAGEQRTILFAVSGADPINFPLIVRSESDYGRSRAEESAMVYSFLGILAIMLVYNLFLYLSIRETSYLLYVAYIAFFLIFALMLTGVGFQQFWPNATWWTNHALGFSIAMFASSLIVFARFFMKTWELFPRGDIGLRVLVGLFWIVAVLSLLPGTDRYAVMAGALTGAVAITYASPLILYGTFVMRVAQAQFFLLGFSVFFAGVLSIILLAFGLVEDSFWTHYGMQFGSIFNVVVLSLGLAHRINTMRRELGQLNATLEQRVEQRTHELENSLSEVKKLKEHQDADYFLTSLLWRPFNSPSFADSHFEIDIAVEQMKKFHFKNRTYEIGGDLCMTEDVVIAGREFLFFSNADAMGKSIQGAGGVLVFGASIKSQLILAKFGKLQARTPELWLRNLTRDIHDLFVSFDGTMFVSAIFGLIDKSTGLLYFSNSEHPLLALYRNGEANFLPQGLSTRKIGMPIDNLHFQLNVFQLREGDVIIAGSDGRDDVLVKNEHNDEILNEDENRILELIEAGKGKARNICSEIKKTARLKDDLSLLTIHCRRLAREKTKIEEEQQKLILQTTGKLLRRLDLSGAFETLRGYFSGHQLPPEAVKYLSFIYRKKNDLQGYASLLRQYHHAFPPESRIQLNLARALRKLGERQEAIDFAESYLCRNNSDLACRSLLAVLYAEAGIFAKSREHVEEIRAQEPDSPIASRLLDFFTRQGEKKSEAPAFQFRF
ncbi:MAG: 7TM diverse intracellular signaling domain-containing protein [Spirochaetota bacterium]